MLQGRVEALITLKAAALGVTLLAGVVTWKLTSTTYATDLRAICQGEVGSGRLLARDAATVTRWVRAKLRTSEGNRFFASLRDSAVETRADRLRREANAARLGSCPMVEAYDRLAFDAGQRAVLQRLCSALTFPGFDELDDDARLARIAAWLREQPPSPLVLELIESLPRSEPAERAMVLRNASRKATILSCDLAKLLDVLHPAPTGDPPVP